MDEVDGVCDHTELAPDSMVDSICIGSPGHFDWVSPINRSRGICDAAMELSSMVAHETLVRNRSSLSRLLVGVLFLVPAVSAQSAKQLIADACHNELQQHAHDTFWASQIQRRENGHIYMEREIETPSGSVHRLFLIDGRKPSPSERKNDDDQLRRLMSNPRDQELLSKTHDADQKKDSHLLSVIPQAFLFEDQGRQGDAEKIGFRPDPAYKPKTFEETALHSLNGTMLIDLNEKRLVELSAMVTQQVDFGFGLLGSLKKGGTIDVKRTRIRPGIWKTILTRIDISGRVVLIKAINKTMDETQSHFTPVPSDVTVDQAIRALLASGSIDSAENLTIRNF